MGRDDHGEGGHPGAAEADRWRALFDEHHRAVWSYARRRCSSGADADDVTAETFAVAWRRRADLPADRLRWWLLATARRVLANTRRSTARRRRLDQRVALQRVHAAEPGSAARVEAALAALGEDQRDLLVMRYWDELAVGEMAEVLGCSANAASQRLAKARAALRAVLEADDGGSRTHPGVRWTSAGYDGAGGQRS